MFFQQVFKLFIQQIIMAVKKNDFVEIEFIGRIKDSREIFDTNIKKEAEKLNANVKPLIVCIGQGILVKGFDKALEGKEIGKRYKIELQPEDAFGNRDRNLIKTIPLRVFKEKNINPVSGMMLNLDGMLAKVIAASGGRIIVDFNNPLAGKEIEYEFTIKKIVTDEREKVNALQDFFFRQRFEFELGDKIVFQKQEIKPLVDMFKDKFKEILGKEAVVEEKKHLSDAKHIKEK